MTVLAELFWQLAGPGAWLWGCTVQGLVFHCIRRQALRVLGFRALGALSL